MKNGVYRHYKGDYYLVVGTVLHSETGENLVLYFCLTNTPSHLYVRPIESFGQIVTTGGVNRFTFVSEIHGE